MDEASGDDAVRERGEEEVIGQLNAPLDAGHRHSDDGVLGDQRMKCVTYIADPT